MSVLEIKGGLYDMISNVNDESLLIQLKSIVADFIEQNPTHSDFWDELSEAQQQELETAHEESKDNKNLVDHHTVLEKYKRWQEK